MKTLELLREKKGEIQRRFHVQRIALFGSSARGEDTEGSDVDVLVEFEPGHKTFDNYLGLQNYLERLFGREVDLVISGAVKPRLKDKVFGEAQYA